jgi:hypothetical protein
MKAIGYVLLTLRLAQCFDKGIGISSEKHRPFTSHCQTVSSTSRHVGKSHAQLNY